MPGLQNAVFNWLPLPDLLLALSFVLLAVALLWWADVLGELLDIMRRPPIEVLIMVAAWVLIIGFALPMYVAAAVFYPNLSASADMVQLYWLLRTVSFFALLIAAALVVYTSVSYFLWTR